MRRTAALATCALGVVAILASPVAREARAEPTAKISDPIPDPGRSIVSNDEASSIVTNPGNLAFTPSPEFRFMGFFTQNESNYSPRGFSFSAAYPLWIFASGLRLDLMNPPTNASLLGDQTVQWIRWGVGGRIGRTLGLGATLGWSISESRRAAEQFSFSAGATWRPFSWGALSVVGRDLNIPASANNATISERSYDVGLAFRPVVGKKALEVGLEASIYEQSEKVVPRATLGVDIPHLGRFRGDVRIFDIEKDSRSYVATAGLDVNFGPAQFSAGAVFGDAVGYDSTGFYAGLGFRWFREGGLPLPSKVVRINVDATPGARGHLHLLRRLWRLADDPEVDGVLLVMTAEPAATLAHADELGDAFRTLRAHGKKVMCHLEDAAGRSLFACSQADRIAMNPAGGLRFSGLSSRYFYLGGTLEKLKVQADFVRIGAHKTAAEQLTNETASDVAKEDHQDLVNQSEGVFMHDVGGGRGMSIEALKGTIAKGPFIATEARAAGLVDELVYPDEVGALVDEVMGKSSTLAPELPLPNGPKEWLPRGHVAVIYLDGDMVDGDSQTIPILGMRLAGSRTISEAFQQARNDSGTKAVVFRLETGGGSSLAADVILREVQLTAKVKPVVISMGSAAASGGYYVAVGGGPIFANRTTITGSIGIFYGKVDLSGLLHTLGVGSDAFRSAPRADAESLFRPFTDDEREELGKKVKQFYDLFVGRVVEGRKMTTEEVDAIARGRVWTGAQAKDRGLVDRIGGFREALEEARKLGDLPDDAPILELPEEDDSLLGLLLGLIGFKIEDGATPAALIPPAMIDAARALAPFFVYGDDKPLARAESFESLSFSSKPAALDKDSSEPDPP